MCIAVSGVLPLSCVFLVSGVMPVSGVLPVSCVLPDFGVSSVSGGLPVFGGSSVLPVFGVLPVVGFSVVLLDAAVARVVRRGRWHAREHARVKAGQLKNPKPTLILKKLFVYLLAPIKAF